MAEFNLLKVDGKPLEKLIEVISQGIGKVYSPRGIRKEADARAYEIEIIERAKSKALSEGKIIEAETQQNIQERLIYKEINRQINIENVTQIAAEQLSQETNVSEEAVDKDWTTRFFNIVEDVSNDEMQKLWGRILAGEVKQPKSYSLRTLELLKNLTKNDAEIFTKASNFKISSHSSPFLFRGKDNKALEKYGMSFEERLLLTEIGILQSETNITRTLQQLSEDNFILFEYGDFLIKAHKKANSQSHNISILRFTKIGEELLNLLTTTANFDYMEAFISEVENENIEIEYTTILSRNDNGTYSHSEWIRK